MSKPCVTRRGCTGTHNPHTAQESLGAYTHNMWCTRIRPIASGRVGPVVKAWVDSCLVDAAATAQAGNGGRHMVWTADGF